MRIFDESNYERRLEDCRLSMFIVCVCVYFFFSFIKFLYPQKFVKKVFLKLF